MKKRCSLNKWSLSTQVLYTWVLLISQNALYTNSLQLPVNNLLSSISHQYESHLPHAEVDELTITVVEDNQDDQGGDKNDEQTQVEVEDSINEESNFIIPYESKKISDFSAICEQNQMKITGQFYEKFKGRIYAFDYPDDNECGIIGIGNPSENITFNLQYGQCGIQMTTFNMDESEIGQRYEISLYVQYSSFLQQIIDEKVSIYCTKNLVDDKQLQKNEQIEIIPKESSRQGRKLKDGGVSKPSIKSASKVGEAWMEIFSGKNPTPKSKKVNPIMVGEDITLLISTGVHRGYDARVVNCTAHDGSRGGNDGFRSQTILDSAGCTVDKILVPNFRRRRLPIDANRNKVMTLHFASFQAFKFPERDHLHLKCTVAFCQGPCPQESCVSGKNHFGSWKDKYGRIADVLLDTAEVVNSILIIAPDLEDVNPGGGHHYADNAERQSGFGVSGSSFSSSNPIAGTTGEPAQQQPVKSTGRAFSDHQSSSSSSSTSSMSSSPPIVPAFSRLGRQSSALPPPPPHSNSRQQQQSLYGSSQQIPQESNNNVCISPGTVILALVIFGVILIISATVTLWIALKRTEERRYSQYGQKHHSIFPPAAPSSYYRFSHW